MSQNQKVTFAVDAKPPNYGPMKIHTKLNKWKKYTVDGGSMPIPLIDCGVPTNQYDIFSGSDYTYGEIKKEANLVKKDTGLVEDTDLIEKDIRLVMFQSGVTREIAITALRKHDGDIVNAIMDL
jgi:NACalpha-BTF3-like transcription factor